MEKIAEMRYFAVRRWVWGGGKTHIGGVEGDRSFVISISLRFQIKSVHRTGAHIGDASELYN